MSDTNSIVSYIDHTLLKPEATREQILRVCHEAKEFKFFGVCVNSSWIPTVVESLKDTAVTPVAVIGFPLGAMSSAAKAFEADWCIKHGAKEIDMVIHLGALKDRNTNLVLEDITAVRKACSKAILKVIIETGVLSMEEKELSCKLSKQAGADFVKTCTGFNIGSATVQDIELMRAAVGTQLGVKASGGIKTLAQAQALIQAGANRLGTSSGVLLAQGQQAQGGY